MSAPKTVTVNGVKYQATVQLVIDTQVDNPIPGEVSKMQSPLEQFTTQLNIPDLKNATDDELSILARLVMNDQGMAADKKAAALKELLQYITGSDILAQNIREQLATFEISKIRKAAQAKNARAQSGPVQKGDSDVGLPKSLLDYASLLNIPTKLKTLNEDQQTSLIRRVWGDEIPIPQKIRLLNDILPYLPSGSAPQKDVEQKIAWLNIGQEMASVRKAR